MLEGHKTLQGGRVDEWELGFPGLCLRVTAARITDVFRESGNVLSTIIDVRSFCQPHVLFTKNGKCVLE